MVMVMYAQCIALCAGLSYEHLRNLRFLGLRRDEHELGVPVDEVLAANRLQLCDDTKGTVRETRAPAEVVAVVVISVLYCSVLLCRCVISV